MEIENPLFLNLSQSKKRKNKLLLVKLEFSIYLSLFKAQQNVGQSIFLMNLREQTFF